MMQDNARRRGLPVSRYIVGLAERDGRAADPGLDVALPAAEQWELLAGVREIRELMLGGEDSEPLIKDMQSQIAVQFNAWSSFMVRAGREQRLHAALAAVLGDDQARVVVDRAIAETAGARGDPLDGAEVGGDLADLATSSSRWMAAALAAAGGGRPDGDGAGGVAPRRHSGVLVELPDGRHGAHLDGSGADAKPGDPVFVRDRRGVVQLMRVAEVRRVEEGGGLVAVDDVWVPPPTDARQGPAETGTAEAAAEAGRPSGPESADPPDAAGGRSAEGRASAAPGHSGVLVELPDGRWGARLDGSGAAARPGDPVAVRDLEGRVRTMTIAEVQAVAGGGGGLVAVDGVEAPPAAQDGCQGRLP